MDYSEEQYDAACEAVGAVKHKNILNSETPSPALHSDMPEPALFHVELDEALWLALDNGLTLAEFIGEVRKRAVIVAKKRNGGRSIAARDELKVGNSTFFRIARGGNKF